MIVSFIEMWDIGKGWISWFEGLGLLRFNLRIVKFIL